ncbi:NYN domain-containing protein [Candidatus Woesearchaeota archaeon]|nr:NYN domain-containing protein [Candidatus Woesearchaeota archaeon]
MTSLQHKDQKVAVLIDVQNMYYSAKHMFKAKVNFKEILKTAVAGRSLIRAIAYVIEADIKGEETFHKALENIGIEVKSKGLQTFIGGAKKGDWDIGLAMDAVRLSNKADTIVIVSGDGDFKDLLIYLKTHGCRTEVIAFAKTASKLIKDEADMFVDLETDKKKYLMSMDKQSSLKRVIKKKEPQEPPKIAKDSRKSVSMPKSLSQT